MIYFLIPCMLQSEFGKIKNTHEKSYIKIQYQEMA